MKYFPLVDCFNIKRVFMRTFLFERTDSKMKRKIAALMAVILAAGAVQSVPFTVFAESDTSASQSQTAAESKNDTSEEEQMKNALALVKSRIEIPEEYSNFSYSTGKSQGMRTYRFTWSEPTENKSYSVQVDGGIITNYNAPYDYNRKPAISSQKPSYFVNKAMSWVYKVNPSMKGFLTKSNVSLSITSNNVSVQFSRSFGGVPVANNSVRVSVDKLTGEIRSYNAGWWQDAEFVSSSDALSQEEIKEIYCSEVTIKPWYHIYEDSSTGKKKTCIVYEPQNSYIYDALTGKHSSMYDDYDKYMDTDKYDRGEGLDGAAVEEVECEEDMAVETATPATGVSFTEEELAAAADLSTMLTSEQFRALIIKDKYMGVTEKYLVNNFNISRNDDAECGYAITCSMLINNKSDHRNVDITADAKSGNIIRFYAYDYNEKESTTELNVKKANTLANSALKYYFGDISGEYKADTDNTAPVSSTAKYKQTSRSMRYNRYVNNIQVSNNNINITVNSAGKVTSVSCSHDRNVDFGDGLIINKETALELLCEQQDMTLQYNGFVDLESKPHTYLQYSMSSWTLNAVNGKLCDYIGEPVAKIEEQPDTCPYTDIAKSPYKNEIEALYEHRVRIYEGTEFKPDEKMTYGEFTQLLDIITGYGYEPMPLEDVPIEEPLEDGKTVSKVEPESGAYFTRMTLAKAFTRAANVDNCAKYTSIFKSPFTDVSANDKDLGYAALAYGMGAVTCGKDGKFYPNAYVTREYAYHCAYNYIKNSTES